MFSSLVHSTRLDTLAALAALVIFTPCALHAETAAVTETGTGSSSSSEETTGVAWSMTKLDKPLTYEGDDYPDYVKAPDGSAVLHGYFGYGDARTAVMVDLPEFGEGPVWTFNLSPFNNEIALHWTAPNQLVAYLQPDPTYARQSEKDGVTKIDFNLTDFVKVEMDFSAPQQPITTVTSFYAADAWLVIGEVADGVDKDTFYELDSKIHSGYRQKGATGAVYATSEPDYETNPAGYLPFDNLAPNKTYMLWAVEPSKEAAQATVDHLKSLGFDAYAKPAMKK